MKLRWATALGLVVGLLALAAGLAVGSNEVESWRLAARWTARAGFPIFLVAYSASALHRLVTSRPTRAMLRDRRWWGLGFALCHTVHLGALLTFLDLSGETRPASVLIVAGGGYVIMYLMVLTSNDWSMRLLGRNWKRLHRLGIHWLWFVFLASYFGRTMQPGKMIEGYLGTAAALAAMALQIAAWRKGRQRQPAKPVVAAC